MLHYRRLAVWQLSHEAAREAHDLTLSLPALEQRELGAQLRRAAYSVPANIVEGAHRLTPRESARYLNIAEASAAEAEYLIVLIGELGLAPPQAVHELVMKYRRIIAMLTKLRAYLRRNPHEG